MIDNFAMTNIQLGNFLHIFVRKLEVPNSKVLLHTLLVNRFWNNRYPSLDVPAQGYLSGSFAILLTNSG